MPPCPLCTFSVLPHCSRRWASRAGALGVQAQCPGSTLTWPTCASGLTAASRWGVGGWVPGLAGRRAHSKLHCLRLELPPHKHVLPAAATAKHNVLTGALTAAAAMSTCHAPPARSSSCPTQRLQQRSGLAKIPGSKARMRSQQSCDYPSPRKPTSTALPSAVTSQY
jgi:hypothetical protein